MSKADTARRKLAGVPAAQRVLLLPHCLRQSNSCKGKYDKLGLQCQECNPDCAINRLRAAAIERGYRGVCVAPGGRLAVTYIENTRPRAVVAVACAKELEEGVQNVNGLKVAAPKPVIVIVPLVKDGCVDTEVDINLALETIELGCPPLAAPAR